MWNGGPFSPSCICTASQRLITVAADVPAPDGAGPPVGIVVTLYLYIHIYIYILHSWTAYRWFSLTLLDWMTILEMIDEMLYKRSTTALQWRHNGRDGVSNHQPHECLLNGLFRRRSKKTPKLRITGLCAVNSPVTGEFPRTKGQ